MSQTVVVIEDNEHNLYLVSYLLRSRGARVVEARDGVEGIARVRDARPSLVLLDIQLPGMDGFAVASALRADPATRHIPIVAVTSHAMVGDREQILAAGCVESIEKPIDPATFASQVLHWALPGGDTSEGDS